MTTKSASDIAKSYIGTPYHQNGRLKGVGIDCGGLLICVGRELGAFLHDFDVNYGASPKNDELLGLMDQLFNQVHESEVTFGDIVVIRTGANTLCHTGILAEYGHSGYFSIIHASSRNGCVVQHRIAALKNFEAVAYYRFKL